MNAIDLGQTRLDADKLKAEKAEKAAQAGPHKRSVIERIVPGLNSMKRVELILFSRMMATFIRAGISILDGIEVVREQTESPLFKRTLDDIAIQLRNGEQLSNAMASHPRVFSQLYIDMIIAAEATGELDAILDQLARYMERAEATSRRLRQAMLYPAIVMVMAAVVIAILTTVVLPSFVALFADFDAELPLPTKIMIAVGGFGGAYGVQTVAAILVLVGLLSVVRDTRVVRQARQKIILRLPVIGKIVRLGIETRFARTLGILLRAGVPISAAFDIATFGTGNDKYVKRLAPVRDRLISGDGITEPLEASGLFGSLLIQMMKVGEETGTLDRYLDQAAEFMDDDLDYKTKQMVTIIEPMLILGVALVVGFVALSVVTPMYGILNQIK
jgi:type IV pilus assembly protein PilC